MPGAPDNDGDSAPPSAPTANTLSARAVLLEPHVGHFTFGASSREVIVRCNCSNFASQSLHVYS
jgi:hypothetical protein